MVVGLGILWNFMMGGLRNLSKMLLFAHFGGLGIFFPKLSNYEFFCGGIRNFVVMGLEMLWNYMLGGLRKFFKMILFANFGALGIFFFPKW